MAKRESGPLLDFVQLKVLYWNLYGLGMAEIEVSDPGIPSLSKSVQRAYTSENVPSTPSSHTQFQIQMIILIHLPYFRDIQCTFSPDKKAHPSLYDIDYTPFEADDLSQKRRNESSF